jgi:hypothetical protein
LLYLALSCGEEGEGANKANKSCFWCVKCYMLVLRVLCVCFVFEALFFFFLLAYIRVREDSLPMLMRSECLQYGGKPKTHDIYIDIYFYIRYICFCIVCIDSFFFFVHFTDTKSEVLAKVETIRTSLLNSNQLKQQ